MGIWTIRATATYITEAADGGVSVGYYQDYELPIDSPKEIRVIRPTARIIKEYDHAVGKTVDTALVLRKKFLKKRAT
jgi:hypothetical protein